MKAILLLAAFMFSGVSIAAESGALHPKLSHYALTLINTGKAI